MADKIDTRRESADLRHYYEDLYDAKLKKEEEDVRKARDNFMRRRENGYFCLFIDWIKSFF